MNEIVYEIIKLVVMVAVLVITRYLVPWIKEKIGVEKLQAWGLKPVTGKLGFFQPQPDHR